VKIRAQIAVAILALLCAASAFSQTPTLVQATSCPDSRGLASQQSSTPDYTCQLPELTLTGNAIFVGLIYDNTNTPTITATTIDGSGTTVDTLSQIVTNTTANANVQRIYAKTNSAGGAKAVKIHMSALDSGYVEVIVGEFYNVSTTASGTAVCNRVASATVTSGSITVASGGLLVNFMTMDDTTPSGSLTAGSGFTFGATDMNDAEAFQYRLGTGSAINPTITQGTSHDSGSCAAGWTAATAGTAPTVANRVLNLAHAQMPASSANPYVIQEPVSGNLIVVDLHGGGDTITGITDSASNTYTCLTGQGSGAIGNADQICYTLTGNTSNVDAISITRSGATHDGTFMTYDATCLGCTFDTSGGGTGSDATLSTPLTVCSSCFTPGAQNELIFSSAGWDFCTSTSASAPSGNLFNSATFSGNAVDGPQTVDQNNGWLMYRNGASVSALSVSWVMNCTGTMGSAIGHYAWAIASFEPPSGGGSTPGFDKRRKLDKLEEALARWTAAPVRPFRSVPWKWVLDKQLEEEKSEDWKNHFRRAVDSRRRVVAARAAGAKSAGGHAASL
jgi:hypothetical protein